jgi:hypothetical protein
MRLPILASVVVTLLVACGGSSEPVNGDSANVTTSNWQQILSCSNGTVVVDVDTNERRNLQVVVRDASSFSVLDSSITFNQIKNPTERIYRGTSPFGIFDPTQFHHLRANDVVADAAGHLPGVEAILENGELRLRQLDLSRPGCEPTSLHSSPPDDFFPPDCEAANFIFHSCK